MRLEVERPEPGLAERVRDALPAVVDVQLAYEPLEDEQTADEIGQLSAAELFTRYFRAQHGADPAPELLALFAELLAEVDDVRTAEAAAAATGEAEAEAPPPAPREAVASR